MLKKITPLIILFCLCGAFFAISQTSDDAGALPKEQVEQSIRSFSDAIRTKDTALLNLSASPRFSVAFSSLPGAWNTLQVLLNHEQIDSIVPVVKRIRVSKDTFKQKTEALVYIQGREPVETMITLDGRDGKILCVDYFDLRFGVFRDRKSKLAAVLPIEHNEGSNSIIIKLKLNNYDKVLRFLFDSGADGMAISNELAEKAGVKANRTQGTNVVGGNMQISISSGNTVHLGDVKLLDQNIAIFDEARENVDGLIGLNIAKSYIVKVDFDEMKMYLYTFGEHKYDKGGVIEHITVPKGVIHIPGYLNLTGKKEIDGNFVFDTGADYFLIGFSPFVRKNRLLLSGFKPERQASTVSMGIATPTYEGTAQEFGFGGLDKQTNMPVSLQASSGKSNWDPGVDGSIGVKLISRYNFVINIGEMEVWLSERK